MFDCLFDMGKSGCIRGISRLSLRRSNRYNHQYKCQSLKKAQTPCLFCSIFDQLLSLPLGFFDFAQCNVRIVLQSEIETVCSTQPIKS